MAMPTTTSDIRKKAVNATAIMMNSRALVGKSHDAAQCLQWHIASLLGTQWDAYAKTLQGYTSDTLASIALDAQAIFDKAQSTKKHEIKPFYAKSDKQKKAARKARKAARKAKIAQKAS